MINRRTFNVAGLASLVGGLTGGLACRTGHGFTQLTSAMKPKRLLLRSSWQVVNIGDIAHTPGVLALLEQYLPDTEVRLWASGDLSEEVMAMEHRRFPKLKIVKGSIGAEGKPSNADLADALQWCDYLLHGSGPSLVAQRDVTAFIEHYQKPYGVYGITYAGDLPETAKVMAQAKFVYFRDSHSLEKAKAEKIVGPVLDFAPDGAFACDLRNDAAAAAWLSSHGLEPGKFACCIPRARYTPYWLIRPNTKLDETKQARNAAMFEHDMAPLRETISTVVRETSLKVLLCPEDRTQMAIGREWIFDKLPADVQQRVVWRQNFWLTDEALSTYVQSAGMFGLEMHSPIMCIGNGIPAIVGRFAEQTSKGYMWRDIGLGDWLFDFDKEEDIARDPAAVLKMLTDREQSATMVKQAQALVHARQAATMALW
ncbi:MAG: polysaccharide pyruvyl transferase family protein [Pirellulaceae bacterium]|nr:polysaccharide pyruvyl transferase family protein [Pirellulaceae bacterium]